MLKNLIVCFFILADKVTLLYYFQLRLSVEILCNQLDETWNSFKQSFKMQVGRSACLNWNVYQ